MPRTINAKGAIISNDSKWLYNWFEMDSICPNDIINVLNEVNGADNVVIKLNSPGGNVFAADDIYTAIATYQGEIEIHVVGIAGSAASEILMACKSLISPVGKVMIHNSSTSASGDYREMHSAGDMLEKVNQSIRNAYKAKTGLTDDKLTELMDKTTFMTAQEAVDYHFVDGILDTNLMNDTQTATVYNAESIVFDEDKVKQLHDLFIKNNLNPGNIKPTDFDEMSKNPQAFINNKQNEGSKTMTLEEVRAQHPEISAEIDTLVSNSKSEGAKEERERMKAIDDISAAVPAEMIVDAKYTNPCTAQDLSLKVLQNSAKQGTQYIKDAIDDSKHSGVEDVQTTPKDTLPGDPTDEDDKLAEIAANAANRGRKGVK